MHIICKWAVYEQLLHGTFLSTWSINKQVVISYMYSCVHNVANLASSWLVKNRAFLLFYLYSLPTNLFTCVLFQTDLLTYNFPWNMLLSLEYVHFTKIFVIDEVKHPLSSIVLFLIEHMSKRIHKDPSVSLIFKIIVSCVLQFSTHSAALYS